MHTYTVDFTFEDGREGTADFEARDVDDAIAQFRDAYKNEKWERIEQVYIDEDWDDEDAEHDRIIEQQELEDFEQADEYFGSASDMLGADDFGW